MRVHAAVSRGESQDVETGGFTHGGPGGLTARYRQQLTVGGPVGGSSLRGSRFRLMPGMLGAEDGTGAVLPADDLDIVVLYAKTQPGGADIAAQTWQLDRDPFFIWEPPAGGLDLAGYSYAMDGAPDDTVDTTATSFNVATDAMQQLTDGQHTFSVQALNTGGQAGEPISFGLWVDTTAPQILSYGPAPGAMLNTLTPGVNGTLSDAHSGVTSATISLRVNGSSVPVTFQVATSMFASTGGSLRQGENSFELRVSDVLGNAQTPLVWSITIDTIPPSGSLVINNGAPLTTSLYVTLSLSASDEISGVAAMRLSNTAQAGYVQEPFAATRPLWSLMPVEGLRNVYVTFVDAAGNESAPIEAEIELSLLSPETIITAGPVGVTSDPDAEFTFLCPEGSCLFSYAFDNESWSEWSSGTSISRTVTAAGNHYFRVKAAKEINGLDGIQPDEEDPSPAERTWIISVETPLFIGPMGPPVKLWRIE